MEMQSLPGFSNVTQSQQNVEKATVYVTSKSEVNQIVMAGVGICRLELALNE